MTAPSQHPIDYAHYFPWTRLFRSFRIATDPRKLILAGVAISLLWCGDLLFSYLPFAPGPTPSPPWETVQPQSLIRWNASSTAFYDSPFSNFLALAERLTWAIQPLLAVALQPFTNESSWEHIAFIWTRLLWAIAVWSIFGGAIARLAAVEFSRDERGGLWQSLKFATARFLSFFAAPLLPLSAVLLIWGVAALGGLLGRVPIVGDWAVAAAWGPALCLALLAVLIMIAAVAGWPLMVAAVATENSDAFDGFSRSFSYLYGRPWLFAWSVGVCLIIGALSVAVIDTLALGVTTGAARMVSTGMGWRGIADLHAAPVGYFEASQAPPFSSPSTGSGAASLVRVWLGVVAMLATGFAASFFWTAATIIYFLLRRADDATHFDEVWIGEAEDEDDLLPLAGIASTGQTVTERSHHPTAEGVSAP